MITRWSIDAETFLTVQVEQNLDTGLRHTQVFLYDRINEAIPAAEFRPAVADTLTPKGPDPLEEGYTERFLNVKDGAAGSMSVRWGMQGPKGRSSSGLN